LYEVPLTLPSRKIITVRITLPRDFPRVPPQLQVFPAVQHRLIDTQMNVLVQAHENLLRWSIHASLGKTVYEIVQKFMQDPPQVILQNTIPTQPVPQNFSYGQPNSNTQSTQQVVSPSLGQTHTPLPVLPSSFPELDSKSPSELAQLLNDENEFKKFFDTLSQVQTLRKVRDDLRINNEELAKKNLAKEAEIERVKRDLTSRYQEINEKQSSFKQKAQRQQEVMQQFSTVALINQLSGAAAEAESASDAIANQFLSGEIDQKTFVKDFMEKRKLYHLRAAKKESLSMLGR